MTTEKLTVEALRARKQSRTRVKSTPHQVRGTKFVPISLKGMPYNRVLARQIHVLQASSEKLGIALAGKKIRVPRRLKAIQALLAAAGLFVGACAPTFTSRPLAPVSHRICARQTIVCSDRLPSASCDELERAVHWWNNQTNVVFFTWAGIAPIAPNPAATDNGVIVVGLMPQGYTVPGTEGFTLFTLTVADAKTHCLHASMVIVNQVLQFERLSATAQQQAFRHELGHVLGLLDNPDPTGLMCHIGYADISENTGLVEAERNSIWSLYQE